MRLYNTLTKTKDVFVPIDLSDVRMYVCGPTVYDFAHIGNARPLIVFDVLFRLLRHVYGADHVTYARNLTDVDDKINARALERGIAIADLTRETIANFHEDVAGLGCLPPTHEPRATGHIADMVDLIETLIAKGHAYAAEGHVLFDVNAMPDYGRLARRSLEEMRAGARVEVAPYKKDPMDFVLWKPSKPGEPSWDSPWGAGRPGWHIECSAMAGKLLGETFDIHGGGIDLVFPHHENEIAQSRCAHGTDVMANIWMHNGFLQVEGEKMSKSLGNFITIRELLTTDRFGGRAWPGEALRLAMLTTHYRQPIDWTVDRLQEMCRLLDRWERIAREEGVAASTPSDAFLDALADDLNTPLALQIIQKDLNAGRWRGDDAPADGDPGSVGFGPDASGFVAPEDREGGVARALAALDLLGVQVLRETAGDADIDALVAARLEARSRKDFAEADRIRDELSGMGVQLMDRKDPDTGVLTTDWEMAR